MSLEPPKKQQFNVYLTPNLIKELKHYCVDHGGMLSHLVEKILQEYLDKKKGKKHGN